MGDCMEQLDTIISTVDGLVNNLHEFVFSQLQKRFDAASVTHVEKRRLAWRKQEQQSKMVKRKKNQVVCREVIDLSETQRQ